VWCAYHSRSRVDPAADGRTANRLYGFLGALAVAKLTDRTLIIPTHLHLDDIQHVDYDALSKEGVQVISEKEYRRLQFVGRLQNSDVALEKVSTFHYLRAGSWFSLCSFWNGVDVVTRASSRIRSGNPLAREFMPTCTRATTVLLFR